MILFFCGFPAYALFFKIIWQIFFIKPTTPVLIARTVERLPININSNWWLVASNFITGQPAYLPDLTSIWHANKSFKSSHFSPCHISQFFQTPLFTNICPNASFTYELNPLKFDFIHFRNFFQHIEFFYSKNILSYPSLALFSTINNLSFTFNVLFSLIPRIKSVAKLSFFHFTVSNNWNFSWTIQPSNY